MTASLCGGRVGASGVSLARRCLAVLERLQPWSISGSVLVRRRLEHRRLVHGRLRGRIEFAGPAGRRRLNAGLAAVNGTANTIGGRGTHNRRAQRSRNQHRLHERHDKSPFDRC
jgi:hypothetical protein